MKIFFLCLTFLFASTSQLVNAQWTSVGTPGFSYGVPADCDIAVSTSGTPYVIFSDTTNLWSSIMKFNGVSWEVLSHTGPAIADPSGWVSIALDNAGVPYVVYSGGTGSGYPINAAKFNGTTWEAVGAPAFANGEGLILEFDRTTNTPYLGYVSFYAVTVMKFNGSSWVNVGTSAFTPGTTAYHNYSLRISASGTPYVAFTDGTNSKKLSVMKFDGSAWITVGTPGFTGSEAWYPDIALDGSGTPYVSFQDDANFDNIGVMKFDGASWVAIPVILPVGYTTIYSETAIEVNATGDLIVGIESVSPVAAEYSGGSWSYLGSSWGFASTTNFERMKLALGVAGTPYVIYRDWELDGKVVVMSYLPTVNFPGCPIEPNSVAFPNPALDGWWISQNISQSVCELKLYDVLGNQVFETHLGDQPIFIDRGSLASGIYHYTLERGGVLLFRAKITLQ